MKFCQCPVARCVLWTLAVLRVSYITQSVLVVLYHFVFDPVMVMEIETLTGFVVIMFARCETTVFDARAQSLDIVHDFGFPYCFDIGSVGPQVHFRSRGFL